MRTCRKFRPVASFLNAFVTRKNDNVRREVHKLNALLKHGHQDKFMPLLL